MSDARRERLTQLLEQRRYTTAIDEAVAQLTSLGLPVHRTDAVTKEAVRHTQERAAEHDAFHLVWHRVWGVRLLEEVLATSTRLGAMLEHEKAVLIRRIWTLGPAHPASPTHVGFLTSVGPVLRQLPAHIGPKDGAVGPGGVGSDLLLVSEDGQSGLRLEYHHHAHSDEYELRSWGGYARVVAEA